MLVFEGQLSSIPSSSAHGIQLHTLVCTTTNMWGGVRGRGTEEVVHQHAAQVCFAFDLLAAETTVFVMQFVHFIPFSTRTTK